MQTALLSFSSRWLTRLKIRGGWGERCVQQFGTLDVPPQRIYPRSALSSTSREPLCCAEPALPGPRAHPSPLALGVAFLHRHLLPKLRQLILALAWRVSEVEQRHRGRMVSGFLAVGWQTLGTEVFIKWIKPKGQWKRRRGKTGADSVRQRCGLHASSKDSVTRECKRGHKPFLRRSDCVHLLVAVCG